MNADPTQPGSPAGRATPDEVAAVLGTTTEGTEGTSDSEIAAPGGATLDSVGEIDITAVGAPTLEAALEAVLLVAEQPLDALMLASLTRRSVADVVSALEQLSAQYALQGRGFDLAQVAGGWRYYTRADCAEVVERYVRDGQQARLTQAALETLSVVAYRQPVSRARISAVRGVNVDGVVRTLVNRGLIEESGTEAESGALLYRTTGYFLERLGLMSLDDLPPLAQFLPDIESLDSISDDISM